MEKIIPARKVNSQIPQLELNKSKRINCQISMPLIIKCQNLITSKHLVRDFTHDSLSDLIRKSLIAHRQGELPLTIPRPTNQPKKVVGIILPLELWEYYQSFPPRHRTDTLECCLVNYLHNL